MNADVPPPARTASCACGGLSVTCPGEPMLVALCHCRECQKRTGGPFGVAAFYPEAAVITEGASTTYRRTGDSGEEITFHFCPTCGSTVFWYPKVKPGTVAVALGAFADGSFPAPAKQVYTRHRHPWVPLDIAPEAPS
ncbi:GFA family protein [Thalassobaculum sp.]|uniref:GFA family protein n=1 Tax=Thalassobaculum sp. TaxID=2022740 RepID=UPI003B5B3087